MKRIVSLILAVLMLSMLIGCGEKDRIMYKNIKLSDYVELADYKNVKVDTSSDDFKEMYDSFIELDVENNNFYDNKTEGKVAEGDVANIDYVGKKDGVAFEGGTAEGYDLGIGSGSFIEGFEEGLIGVNIGDTVDLNLTFPEDYQSEELAGKAVVFTVKVNYVKSDKALEPKEYYKKLGFKTLKDYEKDVKERTIENFVYETVAEKCKVKKYPKDDEEFLQKQLTAMLTSQLTAYGMTLESYLTQNNMTKDDFNNNLLENDVRPMMEQSMPMYAILDKEKIKVTQKDIDEKIKEIVAEQDNGSVTEKELREYYGDYYFENVVANEKAIDVIVKYADVK